MGQVEKDFAATLGRATRSPEPMLFDLAPDWAEHWGGMPDFTMMDATPQHKVTMNFMTTEDLLRFGEMLDIPMTERSNSAWFPHQKHLAGQFEWVGPKTDSKYPVCIPSKGRADCQTTGHVLEQLGVSHRFFVEETEAEEYAEHVGEDRVVSMPFHDLGKGSIPARNFIWEWADERRYPRHWVLDDNIGSFARTQNNRRLAVRGGGFFQAMEDFVDRYENVAMAGPHDRGFVPDRSSRIAPYLFNSRVYSCILIDTTLLHRWRGRYNEDTDLSLRVLKDGLCTILFRAMTMDKGGTYYGSGSESKARAMKGGNTDNVYNDDDHRRKFAESLRDQHPDVVEVVWKWDRWHHKVDYRPFERNTPIFRDDFTPVESIKEYGMKLAKIGEEESSGG